MSSIWTSAYHGWPGTGIRQGRLVLARHRDRKRGHQLESGDPVAHRLPQIVQQADGRRDVRHCHERGDAGLRRRKELQHRGRDDAQRALGADEELLEIVPGIVLAQSAQPVPDAAIGEDHFDAQNELPRVAETKHRGAARVRGKIAANRATPFGGQRQREQQAVLLRRLLDGGQGNSRLDGQRRIFGVDGANAVHPGERQDDGIALVVRRRAAALARVAALRDDRHPKIGARAHHRRDLVRAARAHDGKRATVIAATPIGDIGSDVGGDGEDLRAADGRVEPRPQGCAYVGHERR